MATTLERLATKYTPEPNTGCWLWTASTNVWGYGLFWDKGGNRAAHRSFYEAVVGPVDRSLQLDHRCRVRSRVNPDHLEPVTPRENVRRGLVPGNSWCCGEKSPTAKLSAADVIEIRRAYAAGGTTQKRLADKFGVGHDQVSRIVNGKRWARGLQ